MKTLILKGSVLALSLMLAWSCIKPDQTSTLTVSPVTISFSATAGEKTFTVKSTESWTVEKPADASWLTVYPDKFIAGTTPVTIQAQPLPSSSTRSAILTVRSSSGQTKDIYVEQQNILDPNAYLSFYGEVGSFVIVNPRDNNIMKFMINTNVPNWTPSVSEGDGDWLTYERVVDTLFVSVADIPSAAGRSGNIIASAGGSLQISVEISQLGLQEFGAPTADFVLSIPDSAGTELAFSKVYRNQARMTMLYIGASWCPDCHNFLPKVKELYEEFHPYGLNVYGVFLETEGDEEAYLNYIKENGLEDIDSATGKKIWWESRPVFTPPGPWPAVKENEFTRLFYGDALFTDEVSNYVPAFILVDNGGRIKKTFTANYRLRTEGEIFSLYHSLESYIERQLNCCQ